LARGGVPDHGAQGDLDDQVLPIPAGAALAGAVHAVGGHVFALIAEVHQGGHMPVHLEDHVAAPAAVAAVGSAGGHVFFPVEGHGAVASLAGFHSDFGGIHKACCHGVRLLPKKEP